MDIIIHNNKQSDTIHYDGDIDEHVTQQSIKTTL